MISSVQVHRGRVTRVVQMTKNSCCFLTEMKMKKKSLLKTELPKLREGKS